MEPAALVTGASSGIGRATALTLADAGWIVFGGVRSQDASDALAAERPGRIKPLMLEVTDSGEVARAAASIRQSVGAAGLRGVVCNAGFGIGGSLEDVDLDVLRRHFEVNVVGAVAVVQATLPLLRSGRGRIVLMSSDNGRWTPPFMGPYAASKYALESVGDALRLELRRAGIGVSLVEPGAIRTPIWDKGRAALAEFEQSDESRRNYGDVGAWFGEMISEQEKRSIPPERVADVVLTALTSRRPKARYVVGNDARTIVALRTLLPDRAFDAILARRLPG
jgi:NAD(P)-dependent dehydrogenase (short-subunit alcohol dehydrogenase family)